MKQATPGLMKSLVWHGWNLLRLRGDWKSMPESSRFLGIVMSLAFIGGMAEQTVRGRPFLMAAVVTLSWLAILLLVSRKDRQINLRLAAALGLLSIGIQVALILSNWIPAAEWPVAIWSGIAVMHLLSQAAHDGAGAWR